MFRVLSLREEQQLGKNEILEYYFEFKDFILKRKLTNTTLGALTVAPKLKKLTNKLATKVTRFFCRSNVEIIVEGKENIPEGSVIFASTHQGILDGFVWIPFMPRHCVILHGASVRTVLKLAQMNTGLILVDKDSKKSRQNAKLDMINILIKGHSIMYFPEGTWNLSPNKLHLPISFGFLDIARKAETAIVPVVMEYSYDSTKDIECIKKIHIRFGKVMYVKAYDDLKQKLFEYEEIISTMRWELIEEKGVFTRKSISNQEYKNFLKGNLRNLQLGGIDINSERSHILGADDEFYLFHHINDIPLSEVEAYSNKV
ncbi:MAG: 1-acyl-sn-glycerol-3-phosphate acyltransferase [Lachnospiraceae bacterium]|nr:1-acyl-sn-glycerol-3-phosphate acyltransferase [Lachnospiraceae bacterium]